MVDSDEATWIIHHKEDLYEVIDIAMEPIENLGETLFSIREIDDEMPPYRVGSAVLDMADYVKKCLINVVSVIESDLGNIVISFSGNSYTMRDIMVNAELAPKSIGNEDQAQDKPDE